MMHILHVTWLPGKQRFALWGEDTTLEPMYRKGRRGPTAPHPFALSTDHWLHILDRFTTDSEPDSLAVTLRLPGAGKQVQPSPEAQAVGMIPLDEPLTLFLTVGRIPEKLRHLDADATWSKSTYHGWVYGYGIHLTGNISCIKGAFA